MKAYEQMCSEPVNELEGNYIVYPQANGKKYTAIVGHFV
jgi:hypothetical protein